MITLKTSALRMIKVVFFDWFNTLAHYEPPRHRLHSQACRESGIDISPDAIVRGVLLADEYFFEENIKSPVEKRAPEEKNEVYTRYQEMVLTEAGVKFTREQLMQVMAKVHQLFKGVGWALFDDVISTLEALKQRNLILGMLTNASKDLVSVYHQLGLEPYLDFVVTSEEAGSDKPRPPIFLMALERSGATASEVIHVGDQYRIDIVGARGVGISPVLIDRLNLHPGFTECLRIRTLAEIIEYV